MKNNYIPWFILGVILLIVISKIGYDKYQSYILPANIVEWQSEDKTVLCYVAVRHNNVQALWCK